MENNPTRHTLKIKAQMGQLINALREDVGKVTEAKIRTLFERSAAVLAGLLKAFEDYERDGRRRGGLNSRRPWRKEDPSISSRR